jgi:hypothetical protein
LQELNKLDKEIVREMGSVKNLDTRAQFASEKEIVDDAIDAKMKTAL